MDATIFVVASIILILVYVWKFRENHGKLPPGPWGLPILGYLPFIDSKSPQLTVDKLIKTYGQTVYVNFGQVPCVILSDPKIIRSSFSNCKSVKIINTLLIYLLRNSAIISHNLCGNWSLVSVLLLRFYSTKYQNLNSANPMPPRHIEELF